MTAADLRPTEEAAFRLAYQVADLPSRDDYLATTAEMLARLLPSDILAWNALEIRAGEVEVVSFADDHCGEELGRQLVEVADVHPMVISYASDTDGCPRRLSPDPPSRFRRWAEIAS